MKEITLEQMQRIELDLLVEFDKLCRQEGLRYYMDGGTLLGAMCYQGFIPWDDDIDLKMPRPDYQRFLTLGHKLPGHILLEVPGKDHPGYLFTKLVDDRTVLIEEGEAEKTTGVYLDIFPMDGHPEDEKIRKAHLARLARWNTRFHLAQTGFSRLCQASSPVTRLKGRLYRLLYRPAGIIRRLNRLAEKYPYDGARRVGLVIEGDGEKECFPKAWLEPAVELEFEGHRFFAPPGYRAHMAKFYGDHVLDPACDHNLPRYPGNHDHRVYWKEG